MKINVRGKIAILSLAIAIVVSIIASGHPSITSVVDSSSIIYSSNLESSSYWNRYDGLHIGDQVTKEEDIESTTGSEIETVNSIGNASPTATAIADIPVIVEDLGGKHSIAAIKHSLYTDNAVELERARTQYGEYYELSDGRMAALLSTAPIHYETSKGTYQLIDDNIIPDNIQNDYAFTNAASSFSVHFPGTAEWTTDVLFHSQTGTEMHLGSQSEVWYKSAIGEDELLYQSHNSVAVTEGNTISYPERYPYVTEVFTIKPQGIKHNYIMNQAASFMDDHIGGTIEFQEVVTLPAESYLSVDGEVQTYDFVTDHDIHVVDASGSSFAIFPAPWAHEGTSRSFDPEVDSWLSLSYRVTYLAECVVQIAVCVPLDWLTEPERSYPVTIDPSIYCYENHSYDDCYAIGSDQFYYSTEYLKVGYRSDYGLPYYLTQMTWHNVNIPPGSTIDYVRLSYVPYDDYSNTCSFRLQFEAADDALPCAYQYPAERDYVSHSTLFSPYSTVWTQGQRRSFTGFVAGLQEVIDRPGWESGNNVAMRWCAYTASGGYRQIYSYDYSSSYAPYLYVEYTPRFDEPWLEQSGCYVSPNSVANGGQLTVYYRIYNPNSDDLPVALGCSIRKNGTDTWVSDPPHDKSVTATPDYSDHYRYFDVPCDAELGSYDVAWGLWETIPGTPWDYLGKTNQFTIVEQAYSVYGVISDFVGDADQDGDGYYETYDFLIGIDGDVSTDCATNVYGKMICTTTGQSWGSASSWAISGTTTDYHYFAFDETDFAGEISENTDLDFTVELWNQSKTIKLATDTSVLGEPVKVDYLGKQQTRIVGDRFVHKTAKIGIPLLLEAHLQNYDWWIWWNLAGQTVHFDIYYSGQWHEIDDDGISETSFVTDGDGIASVYYTAPKALSPGDYLIRARYDGSSSYEPCELERTIEIKKPNWLYMIYMCGDNDLDEAYVSSFYNDIAKIDVNNEVSVVVLFDRPDNTPHNPVWTTGHYFRISDDALIINDWGEINMGSGTVLDTFITTTLDTCDAYNKALVFKNHGSGWVEDIHIAIEHGDLIREELYQHVMPPEFESLPPDNGVWEGVIYDDDDGTNNRDNLQLFEIRQALNGHGEFGLIAYHACVMGTVEVIYDLLTYTELVVVSEDNTFSSGWKYGDHLSTSVLTSSTSPLQLTQTMVDVCTQNTLGGWDLANSNIASLNTEISSFADRLIDLLPEPGIMTSINTARINARKFRAFGGGAEIYVDLRQFALGIATLIPDTTLQTRANAVANRLSTSTFRRCWKTSYEATLGGLSIYFPPNDGGNEYDYYFTNGVLTFTTNPAQHWDDFLDLYFDAIDPMCQIIAPNSGGWYKNDISVAATASDENGVKYVEFQYSIDQSNWYALPGPDSADGRDWYGDNGWELTFRTTDTIHGVIDDSSVWVRARACDNAGNIGLWDECDVSFGVDNTEPLVEFFDVIPGSVILGNGFTIGYIVSDILGSGLKQTELWRANDVNGLPDWDGTENPIDTHYFVGIDSTTGSFYDIPDSVGLYWYGIHVVDDAGNWVPEDSPIQVCVGVTEVCNGIDDDCDGLVDDDDPDCTGQATWYLDGDSDGYGDPNTTTQACSQPAGYVDNDADCNDSNENVNPAATEVCNGIDDDCDGLVDDDDPDCTGQATWYLDGDSDGYGDPNNTTQACSQPAGYVDNDADCNDSNENVNPAATEVCNGIDDDCDGLVDDDDPDCTGQATWYLDGDSDGYGDPNTTTQACSQPAGYVDNDADCNDSNENVNPAATEVCNGIDDDCDGLVDDDDPDCTGQATWYLDGDSDGYGDPNTTTQACSQPAGYVANDADCDDSNANVNPGAIEVCNGIDDDCDGLVDDDDPDCTGQATWYLDGDSDGYGDPNNTTQACSQPAGYVDNDADCNDSNENVNPAATEVCNGIDDDCDGLVDDDDPDCTGQATWYLDGDSDGYGDPNTTTHACSQPAGYVDNNADCDDSNENVNPAATEVCNGIDDDCDGLVEDDDPDCTGQATWYLDGDSDGYGDPNTTTQACSQPAGYVDNDADCNDSNENVNPAATEVCNGIDDDCDGLVDDDDPDCTGQATWYLDGDSDGYGDPNTTTQACSQPAGYVDNDADCNDSNANVNPGAIEVCNGIDDDCDGLVDDDDPDCTGQATWYLDGDSDGYGDPNTTTQACSQPAGYVNNDADCNDSNENVNPAATEVCNGIDDDCDGLVDDDDPDCTGTATWYLDGDSDGYGDPNTTTHACSQPAGYVDNNADCDDSNENVNPAATEVCNGIDDDCDGLVDEGCDNEVYLDSQSSHTSFCCMVDVEIWGNTTDSFLAGQMNLAYDPTCGNVTDFVPNLTDFMLMDWNLDTPGEALITFLAPEEMSGEYLIGTLSIHGLCEHEDCFTTLDFVDAESDLTDKAGSPIPVNWIDGTFECGGVCGDVNNDDHVNVLDMVLIGQYFGQTGSSGWIPEDVKKDGVINVLDMIIIGQHWTG